MEKHIAHTQEISTINLDIFMCNLFPLRIYVSLLTKLITINHLGNYYLRYPIIISDIHVWK